MKSVLLSSMLVLSLFIGSCASSKSTEQAPFKISKATAKAWVGGVKGVSGTHVLLYADDISGVRLENMYFRGNTVKIQLKKDANGNPILAGYFNNTKKQNTDLILSNDPNQEYGNSLPNSVKQAPFTLKDNQAIVSYTKNGKLHYYKVEDIEVKSTPEFYN